MSLCDHCFAPGACCKKMTLTQGGEHLKFEDIEHANNQMRAWKMPFVAVEVHDEHEDGTSFWWTCPALGKDGRCTIYEDRPETCRIFEPASERLCVHWRGAEGGEMNILGVDDAIER